MLNIKHIAIELKGIRVVHWLELENFPALDTDEILRWQFLTERVLQILSRIGSVLRSSQLWLLQTLSEQAQEGLWQGCAILPLFAGDMQWNFEFMTLQTSFLHYSAPTQNGLVQWMNCECPGQKEWVSLVSLDAITYKFILGYQREPNPGISQLWIA